MEGVIDVEDHTSSSGRLVFGMLLGFGEQDPKHSTIYITQAGREGREGRQTLLFFSLFFSCALHCPFLHQEEEEERQQQQQGPVVK